MKTYGRNTELSDIKFRGDTYNITVQPNASTTYTADRTISLPNQDASDELVSLTATQTLTNKTLSNTTALTIKDTALTVQDNSDTTKQLTLELSGISPSTTRTLTIPDASGTITVNDAAQTLTNKTLLDSTTVVGNVSDATKALKLSLGGATANKTMTIVSSHTDNRSLTLPDATDTIVALAVSQTLTNKKLDDTTTEIVDTSDPTKKILFNAGGTAGTTTTLTAAQTASRVLTLPDATDTLLAAATAAVITNKDIDGGTASNTLRLTVPKNSTASLAGLTRKAGTLVFDTSLNVLKYDDGSNLNTIGTASTATSTVAGLVTSYVPVIVSGVKTISSANYIILDNDGFETFLVTTGSSNRTLTLPTAANNAGRTFKVVKADSGTGQVQIVGTINGSSASTTVNALNYQYGTCTIYCDGTNYFYTEIPFEQGTYTPTLTNVAQTSSRTAQVTQFVRRGNTVAVYGGFSVTFSGGAGANMTCTLPCPPTSFTQSYQLGGTATTEVSSSNTGWSIYATTSASTATFFSGAATGDGAFAFNFNYRIA